MIQKEVQEARKMFMSLSVLEHHISSLHSFSTYEICEILSKTWKSVEKLAKSNQITLELSSVLKVNYELATAFNLDKGEFLKQDEWNSLVTEVGEEIDEDPSHILNWMFSSLYWDHLTQLKIVTAWFYTTALRVQHNLPIHYLSPNNIGEFLETLSGSGPPIYDGQTFFLEEYSQIK